mgnify:CR=1 FL=1
MVRTCFVYIFFPTCSPSERRSTWVVKHAWSDKNGGQKRNDEAKARQVIFYQIDPGASPTLPLRGGKGPTHPPTPTPTTTPGSKQYITITGNNGKSIEVDPDTVIDSPGPGQTQTGCWDINSGSNKKSNTLGGNCAAALKDGM